MDPKTESVAVSSTVKSAKTALQQPDFHRRSCTVTSWCMGAKKQDASSETHARPDQSCQRPGFYVRKGGQQRRVRKTKARPSCFQGMPAYSRAHGTSHQHGAASSGAQVREVHARFQARSTLTAKPRCTLDTPSIHPNQRFETAKMTAKIKRHRSCRFRIMCTSHVPEPFFW